MNWSDLAAEKPIWLAKSAIFIALTEAREHTTDREFLQSRYPTLQSAVTWDVNPILIIIMRRILRSQKPLVLDLRLPVPIEPSPLSDLSVILWPSRLSGPTRAQLWSSGGGELTNLPLFSKKTRTPVKVSQVMSKAMSKVMSKVNR